MRQAVAKCFLAVCFQMGEGNGEFSEERRRPAISQTRSRVYRAEPRDQFGFPASAAISRNSRTDDVTLQVKAWRSKPLDYIYVLYGYIYTRQDQRPPSEWWSGGLCERMQLRAYFLSSSPFLEEQTVVAFYIKSQKNNPSFHFHESLNARGFDLLRNIINLREFMNTNRLSAICIITLKSEIVSQTISKKSNLP